MRGCKFSTGLGFLAYLIAPGLMAVAADADQQASDDLQLSEFARLAPHSLLLDATIVDERVVVVGERGHVLVSQDSGQTWAQISVPTRATLTSVFFTDAEHGWAVGHDAVIIKTEDGGQNWRRVNFAPDEERPLLDVWFASSERGIAIGAYGNYLETEDGGESWQERVFAASDPNAAEQSDQDTETELTSISQMSDFLDDEDPVSDLHLNNISLAPDGTLYIAAEAGHIFRSEDNGDTWIALPSPYEGSFYGVQPLRNNHLLLFGLRGKLFYSDNKGLDWQPMDAGTDAILMGSSLLVDGRPIIAGLGGTLLLGSYTADDQQPEFKLLQQEDRKALAIAIQTSANELVLVGEDGVKKLSLSDNAADRSGT